MISKFRIISKCRIILGPLAFKYPRQSGKRSKLRVSWSLLTDYRWSLARDELSRLYVFSLIWGIVVGEAIDNSNFLLIWISIINSTPFTVFDLLPQKVCLPPTWVLLINSIPPNFHPEKMQVFFSSTDECYLRLFVSQTNNLYSYHLVVNFTCIDLRIELVGGLCLTLWTIEIMIVL